MNALRSLRLSHFSAGFVAVMVGYSSAIAIVLQAAQASGASHAWLASWLLSLGLCCGLSSILLSWHYRMPILTAWSTPGAALVAASLASNNPAQAVACFMFAAALGLLLALSGRLNRLMAYIPKGLASAMLAGILVNICLKLFTLDQQPLLLLSMFITYLAMRRWRPAYTMPVVLLIGLGVCGVLNLYTSVELSLSLPKLVWVTPQFDLVSLLGVGLPLFIVTLSSQNLTGLTVLKAHGYEPPSSPLVGHISALNLLAAPFGCFSICLAAITAAICMDEQAEPRREQRYLAAIAAGLVYLLFGLAGVLIIALFQACPPTLSYALAALALVSTISHSLHQALQQDKQRDAAIICFLITAGGANWLSIGAPFWGLLLGSGMLWWQAQRNS